MSDKLKTAAEIESASGEARSDSLSHAAATLSQMADEFCRWKLPDSACYRFGFEPQFQEQYGKSWRLTHAEALAMFTEIVGPKIAALEADLAAMRELHCVYNLGGMTDYNDGPMKRALAAEAELARLREQEPVAWMTAEVPPRVASDYSRSGMFPTAKESYCIPLYAAAPPQAQETKR